MTIPDQPILFTMSIKSANWDRLKQSNDAVFGALIGEAREAGLKSRGVYRREAKPDDVLFVSEWRSQEAFEVGWEESTPNPQSIQNLRFFRC